MTNRARTAGQIGEIKEIRELILEEVYTNSRITMCLITILAKELGVEDDVMISLIDEAAVMAAGLPQVLHEGLNVADQPHTDV